MYKIDQMELVGEDGEAGLCISWIPNGLLIELAQKKLDTLRIQYEHQVSSLQRQLEAERRNNEEHLQQRQQDYAQLVSELRSKLDTELQQKLDQAIHEVTHVHTGEIQQLHVSHQNEVSLELTALKLSLEQIYVSKGKLELSEQKARFEQRIEALNKQHKEELNKLTADSGKPESCDQLSASLTQQYNQLIQRISRELEERFPADNSSAAKQDGEPMVNGEGEHQVPLQPTQEMRSLLLNQQQEITSLRSKLLTEYESVLQSRTEVVQGQTHEVSNLEERITDLQKQYDVQLRAVQQSIHRRDEEQKQESEEDREKFEAEQAQLKSYYETKLQDLEAAFDKEISSIKEKYEEQISNMIQARLSEDSSGASRETSQDRDLANLQSSQQREYIHKTMALTAVSDTDSDSVDIPRSPQTDLSVRLKELELELAERDVQVKELRAKLDSEETRSDTLDRNIGQLKEKLEEVQQQASDALSQCTHLQEYLEEKDSVIRQLEVEKGESEKLYRDLLEKESPRFRESPRSRSPVSKEQFSGSSVDDSFTSARDDIQDDTPRSGISDLAEYKSPRSDMAGEEDRNDNASDMADSIPFANDSAEFVNENLNNNCSTSSLESMVESLQKKVEELDRQLEEAKDRETKLRTLMEEKEHGHKEMMETLKQELEHEKKMEVETLQSEFRIQMEVELKRQAAELSQTQTVPTDTSHSPQVQDQTLTTSSQQLEETTNLPLCANNNALPSQESFQQQKNSRTASESSSISEHIEADLDSESQNPLMQTSAFDTFGASVTERLSPDSANLNGENAVVEENLSDDSKATTSAVSSPTHVVTTSLPQAAHALPLTDIEKEMEAMREEYEAKLTKLKEDLEQAEEERTTLTFTHQQQLEDLRKQLNEAEERYDRLMEGVQNGEHPELNQLMKDKYDQELELTKSLMQNDFDEALKSEKKKFVEKHRKLMGDFMDDRGKEEEELKGKHEEELTELKQTLTRQFEEKLREYEQEIERLTRDLDLLKDANDEDKDQVDGAADDENPRDSTLPEIDEITLSFQDQGLDIQSASPDSQDSRETSTPVKRPQSCDAGVQYEESEEEETEAQIVPTLQIRSFADVVKTPPPMSSDEKRDMEFKIQQLVAQVERLTHQLAEAQGQESLSPKSSPQHSPHSETLKGEDAALVAMLQSDLERISAEREGVQRINDRLLSLLSDSVKTYVGVEDTINRKLSQVVTPRPPSRQQMGDGASCQGSRPSSVEPGPRLEPPGAMDSPASDRSRKGATPDGDTSHDSQALENTSILSNATDEGLEISQRLAESIFVGPDLDAEGEEILTDARGRLQTAVGQLLELMERSTTQLIEAKATQQELLDTLAARAREVDLVNSRCTELDSQLAAEIEAKEYLGLELHKAEGLISGYSSERESLETQIQTLEEQREALIVELDTTRSRLDDFQRSQSEIDSMRQEVGHQQQLLRENAGQEMQAEEQQSAPSPTQHSPALLGEVASLNNEKRELSNQLQYQLDQSRKQLTEQEAAAEEAERRHETALEERNRALEDLRLQLENVERQLKASKAFVDEQMAEREQEREEHQKEIERLEEMLEGKDKTVSSQQRLQREIADLTEQLQSRMANQSAMHQRILDLQKSLEDKELSAHDMKTWVSQLEGELDQRGNVEEQLKQRINRLERQLTEKSDGSDEADGQETTTVSERPNRNSPTPLSPTRQTLRHSAVSLEEEVQRTRQVEEELRHENNALKEQVQQQMLQISGLKNQLDQLRHYGGQVEDTDAAQLRLKLQAERDNIEKMEEKLSVADSKIETLESILRSKEEEAEMIREKVTKIMEMGDAQEENENLKSQLEELQSQISSMSSLSSQHALPPELLEEKNHEIEELRSQLRRVEAQMSQRAEEETMHQEKIRDLQIRLKERDEEISDLQDNITSLRRGEPCLDVSLPLNEDAGNMLNISMTGRTTRSARAVTPTSIAQEFEDTMMEREGELSSLREEVEQTKKELADKDAELRELQDKLAALTKENQDNQTDQEKIINSLEESVQQKDKEIYELTLSSEELKHQLEERDVELTEIMEDRDKSLEQLHEKEDRLDQMVIQIDSLQQEISSLTTFQQELQKDFDTVQSMLDEKEKEIESLTKELTDNKTQAETLETVLQLEKAVTSLQKDLVEKQNVVDEKEEELYELHDKLEEMGNVKEELDGAKSKLAEISAQLQKELKLKQELEESLAKEKHEREEMEKQKEAEEKKMEEKFTSLETSCRDKDNRIKDLEEKAESLESEIQKEKEKAETEVMEVTEKMKKMQEDYEQRIQEMESQLHVQEANNLAMQMDSEQAKNLMEEMESLKLKLDEKDSELESLQKQLQDTDKDRETIDTLKSQIESKDKELEEFSSVKRQLEETEEQLRLRQTALLDMQADKEQLLLDMGEVGELKLQLEEKDQNIAELEGQLRFRQSCILDMEADKERILEEREDMETDLRNEIQDKEQALQELQEKYDELKASSEKGLMLRKSEAGPEEDAEGEIEGLNRRLSELSEELADMTSRQKQTEERLAQTSQQLAEREEQIQQLQAEVQNLQAENSQPQVLSIELEMKVEELENQLQEAERRADVEAVNNEESQQIISRLEKELDELKTKGASESQVTSERTVSLSSSLPLHGTWSEEPQQRLSRWESEPASLAIGNRDSVYLRFRMTEVERLSRQQQKELSEKNHELDRVRQDLETWLKKGKGQDALQLIIKEKESSVVMLRSEVEVLRTQLDEKEQTIISLRSQLQALQNSLEEGTASKDRVISELHQQVHHLQSSRDQSLTSPKSSASDGESLSPETTQSLSHLKLQLRKAHAALEEMQQDPGGGGVSKSVVEQELEDVRQILRDREEQLASVRDRHRQELEMRVQQLKTQHDEDLRQLRQLQERKLEQSLTDQRQALEKQHKTELNELRLKYEKDMQGLREEGRAASVGDHSVTGEESMSSSVSEEDAMPGRLQALLNHLNSLGEHLLSVSDLQYLQQHLHPAVQASRTPDAIAWSQERRSLMDNIDALKDLLQQADTVANMSDEEQGDWRSELLQALVSVYEKERRVLQSEVNTADSLYPEVDIMTQLESRIHDLEQVHQSSLDDMLRADRQSMIDEIDSLHRRLLEARNELQDARDQLSQRIAKLEEAKSSAEWKLQRQVQMLEYKLQQEGVVQEDLKKSLKLERQRVSELSGQSNHERSRTLELQSELSSTQIHLSKVKDALEREQQRFSSVTDALEEERAKTNRLTELLDSAKRKMQSLQEEVAQAGFRHQQQSESEEGYIKELQTELKKERQRSSQFSEAEEEAKREVVQLSDEIGLLKRKLSSIHDEYEAKIEALHREHMEKELQRRLEGDSEAVSKLTELLDTERDSHQAVMDQERKVIKQLKRDLDQLKSENGQLKQFIETEKTRADMLKSDLDRVRSELTERAQRGDAAQREIDSIQVASHKQLKMVQKDREELKLKVNELEEELGRVQDRARELEHQLEVTRQTKPRPMSDSGQQTRSSEDFHKEAINTLITASVVDQELKLRLAQCCTKLHGVAVQLQGMASASQHGRRVADHGDNVVSEENETLSSVVAELRQLKSQIKEKESGAQTENGAASRSGQVSELLEHNQQLAEHIVRLKQEKERLTESLKTLERRLQTNVSKDAHAQMNLPQYSSDSASEEDGVYDRTIWASERLSLQMALDSAEHEIQRLRTEIQNFRSMMNSEGQIVKADPEKSARLYGKYLRAESFRKALIYQKKYLLLLLGGYRDTEQETLAILASMGGFPSPHTGLYSRRIRTRAFMIFRSAGRVVIAIFRMKYLVRKWKRATRVGSPVMTGQINHHHAYVPSTSSYPSHQRWHQTTHQHQQHSSSSNLTYPTHSSSSIDYIDSLSNGDVSTLATSAYPAAAAPSRPHNYTTPPTKDHARQQKSTSRGNREEARRRILQDEEVTRVRQPTSARSRHSDDDNFLHYLENVQQQLSERDYGSPPSSARRVAWR